MIWIQTAWHSTDIPERSFEKKKNNNKQTDFENISADDKTMTNYLVGKKRANELKWKVLHVHACFMLKPYICLLSILHGRGPL